MLTSLRIQRDAVSMEAFVSLDIAGLLKNVFPTIKQEFNSFVNVFSAEEPAIILTSKQTEFVKEVNKHIYLNLAPLTAYVPEGLQVSYLDYSQSLLMATEHAAGVLKTLSDYSTYLSLLVNNPEQKIDTASFERLYKDLEKRRIGLNGSMGSCFKYGSTKTEVTIGDIVKRNNDWSNVFHISDGFIKLINSVDRKVLNKKIVECTTLIDNIGSKISRNEFVGMSPQAIKNLSEGAYQIASELEFFSAIYYKVSSYSESINRTVLSVQKVLTQ